MDQYQPTLPPGWWELRSYQLDDLYYQLRNRVVNHDAAMRRIGFTLLDYDLARVRGLLTEYWSDVEVEADGSMYSSSFSELDSDFIAILMECHAVWRHLNPGDQLGTFETFHYCSSCSQYHVEWCEHCDECVSCHTCVECSECEHRVSTDNFHRACGRCEDCCECQECSACGRTRSGSFCSECENCEDCCSCNEGCNLSSRAERREPWRAVSPAARLKFPSQRLCGVEWEFNLVKQSRPLYGWCNQWGGGIHGDSSAGRTDNDSGWEAVTPPISGDHIRNCLSHLGEALDDSDAKVNDNCGIHVHVDASDFYWADMFRLLKVFAHVEPVLFVIAGQNRHTNQYCYQVGPVFNDALSRLDRKGHVLSLAAIDQDQPSPWIDAERGRSMLRNKNMSKKEVGRYRALNIVPWLARYRGRGKRPKIAADATVEFRMHKHSLDWERITQWAELCVTIVDWISKATDAEAESLLKMTSLRAIATIAPRHAPWILQRVKTWKHVTRRNGGTHRAVRFVNGVWKCAD